MANTVNKRSSVVFTGFLTPIFLGMCQTQDDPLEFIQEDKKELLLTLEHIIDTIVSPDRLLRFEKNSLNNEKNIQLTRFQMKILSMITMGNSSINKLVSALNGSQLKIAETICYLKDSGFIDIEP